MRTQRLGDRLGAAVAGGYALGFTFGPSLGEWGRVFWALFVISMGYLCIFGFNNATIKRWGGAK